MPNLQPFNVVIPPGVVKDATPYAARGRWIDSNLIRFREGKVEDIGGWEPAANAALIGVCRNIRPFSDLNGNKNAFFGTNSKAYVWYTSTSLNDVTPVLEVNVLANPISTTISLVRVGVTLPPAAVKAVGNYIIISGSSAVGGIPAGNINGERLIVEVIGNTVFFDAAVPATSTVVAGGGAAVTVTSLWPTGLADPFASGTWGLGGWGSGSWGGVGTTTLLPIRFWWCDNWGEDLLISPSDGPIFYWDATSPSARALPISGMVGASQVPVACRQVLVSNQTRIVIAFACNAIGSSVQDPMLIRWSDNENYLEWDPSVAGSAAGEIRLTSGSVFVTALEAPNEILAWTDTTLYGITASGTNDVFVERVISPSATIYGPKAATIAGDAIYWWGEQGFYRYAGAVQLIPSTVEDYVMDDLDKSRAAKTIAGSNSKFHEVWWFYVSKNSLDGEPDKYVKVNYEEGQFVWDIGRLDRSCWTDADIFPNPIATTPQGTILYHELGLLNPFLASPISGSIESGPIQIDQSGYRFIATRFILPDIVYTQSFGSVGGIGPPGGLQVSTFFTRGPGDTGYQGPTVLISALSVLSSTGGLAYNNMQRIRGRGRDFRMKIAANNVAGWRMGDWRLFGLPDGRK